MRALGYGWKVCMIQFIKGTWKYGEMESLPSLAPSVELHRMGKGFYKIMGDKLPEEAHKEAAQAALKFAAEKMESGEYDLVILDELNVAVETGLLDIEDVLSVLEVKPKYLHVIVTGRGAHPRLVEMADLVTEMQEVKHPFQKGIKAQKGIDY